MAVLENIYHQSMIYNPESPDSKYGFVPNSKSKKIKAFPQIFFSDGEPWKEANQYAFSRFYDSNRDIKTVSREINHLAKYADWLEQEKLHWLHFPKKKRERCLFRFRGFLIECREQHLLAPSTVSQIMSSTVKFYRWASPQGLADSRSQLWDEEFKLIKFFDKQGFSRTMGVLSTELVIPNRKRGGDTLEDGLLPLTQQRVKTLMLHLKTHSNYELYLMHKVALLTGCRYETVTTLTIGVLNNAYQDPNSKHLMRVRVGPSTPVKTKFDVSGEILFPASIIQELADYFNSAQAILRRVKAPDEYHSNIFLTSQCSDFTMRSMSRFLIEDADSYVQLLRTLELSDDVVNEIAAKGTSIGFQPVKTVGTKAAIDGDSGFQIFPDYRGVNVLSAYKPINVGGLNWAIMSEIDEAEAFAPIIELKAIILLESLIAVTAVSLIAAVVSFFFAVRTVQPINTTVTMIRDIAEGDGDLTQRLADDRKDELGELAHWFNSFVDK